MNIKTKHIVVITIITILLTYLSSCKQVESFSHKMMTPDEFPNLSEFIKYDIDSGTHASHPSNFKFLWRNTHLSGYAYFDSTSIYYINNSDSLDWNKLIGYKLDVNSVPNHASMVGWRYNRNENVFEICPYFNKNGIVFPDVSEVLKVELSRPFRYEVILQGKEASVLLQTDSATIIKEITLKKQWLYLKVSPWFGGTSEAPNDLSIYLKED